jgi:outer membrane immunogenic protein
MKAKRVTLSFILSLCAGAAIAADMPVKAPAPLAPVASWTGFYLGANIGGGVGQNGTQDVVSYAPPGGSAGITNPISEAGFTHSPAGFIGGGQLGYNWQTGNLVLGIEGDWDWADRRSKFTTDNFFASTVVVAPARLSYSDEQQLKWLATARARVGWARGSSLWYVTGGAAWGEVGSNYNFAVSGSPIYATAASTASLSAVKSGWTVGGGVETSLAWLGQGNWSAKLEYLYVDLGSVSNTFTVPVTAAAAAYTFTGSGSIRDHIVRTGLNYRFGGPGGMAPTIATAAPAMPAASWTGLYLGANVGGALGHSGTQDAVSLFPPGGTPGVTNPVSEAGFTHSPAGFVGGGQLGYNWQTSNLVLGVEGDWDFAEQRNTFRTDSFLSSTVVVAPARLSYSDEQLIKWLATARARVGWAQGSSLWYVTGGAAWGKVDSNYNFAVSGSPVFATAAAAASSSNVKSGWTVGGGVETSLGWLGFGNNWSTKLEYLYVDLGNVSNTFTVPVAAGGAAYTFTGSSNVRDHVVRAGLNYRFASR